MYMCSEDLHHRYCPLRKPVQYCSILVHFHVNQAATFKFIHVIFGNKTWVNLDEQSLQPLGTYNKWHNSIDTRHRIMRTVQLKTIKRMIYEIYECTYIDMYKWASAVSKIGKIINVEWQSFDSIQTCVFTDSTSYVIKQYKYSTLSISQGVFSLKNLQCTLNISRCFFSKELSSFLPFILCSISCYIQPPYIKSL